MSLTTSRRRALKNLLLAGGGLGLASFATGLPPWLLAAAARPRADGRRERWVAAQRQSRATFLLAAWSQAGDPINANVPGTYADPDLVHPPQPSMAPTPMRLGSQATVAAAPWAKLDPAVLARTAFIHHATGNVVHADVRQALSFGAGQASQPLFGWLAKWLAGPVHTATAEPIVLGTSDRRPSRAASAPMPRGGHAPPAGGEQSLLPTTLAALLTASDGPLAHLADVREATLANVSAACRTALGCGDVLNHHALSATELKGRIAALQHSLASIGDGDASDQVRAAVGLVAIRAAPVLLVDVPFGGDNHHDQLLAREAKQTVAGVGALALLQRELAALGLQDQVTFASLGVFGRTLSANHLGSHGRDHNAQHNVAVLMGPGVRGAVVGGVARTGSDYGAARFAADSGAICQQNGVAPSETLLAAGTTLARACGMAPAAVAQHLPGGQPIEAALSLAVA